MLLPTISVSRTTAIGDLFHGRVSELGAVNGQIRAPMFGLVEYGYFWITHKSLCRTLLRRSRAMSVPRKIPHMSTRDQIVLGKIPIVLWKIYELEGKNPLGGERQPRAVAVGL